MSRALDLECFRDAEPVIEGPLLPSFAAPGPPEAVAAADGGPDLHAAYDLGFKTGREACEQEFASRQSGLSAELVESLQALSFTWHEARAHVLASLAPLLRTVFGQVLPAAAAHGWGETVISELLALAGRAADAPVTILVAPALEADLAARLAQDGSVPFRIAADAALTPLQCCFRLGQQQETMLDLDGVLAAMNDRLESVLNANLKDIAHG